MTAFEHITVLLNETVEILSHALISEQKDNSLCFADCTLGGAGHTLQLLKTLSACLSREDMSHLNFEIICCDQDPVAIRVAKQRIENWLGQLGRESDRIKVTFLESNFRFLPSWMKENRPNAKLAGLMADLGVSSPQLDEATRGFSFLREGPLDMRMNTNLGKTAKDLLLTMSEHELTNIFQNFGEEPRARALAKAIVKDRNSQTLPLSNTVAFAQYVARVLGYHQSRVHPATRIFQALRIAVNEELAAVEELLNGVPDVMGPNSWVAVISFHSLEDRLVKRYFRAWEAGSMSPNEKRANEKQLWLETQMGLVGHLNESETSFGCESPRGGITASEEEIAKNSRSRSARLRGFNFTRNMQKEM